MRIFYVNFSTKTSISCVFPLLENTTFVQNDFTFSSWEYWGFRFFQKKISLIFQSPLQPPILPQHWPQTSIYPVPKAKLPVSDFVLLVPSCLTYATMLFMVFCCCSTDIILNRFPGWEMIVFPSQLRSYQSAKRLLTSKGVLYTPGQFASRQNYSGSSSGFLPFPSVRICPSLVGCKRASIHRNLFVIRPQTIALCIRIRQNSLATSLSNSQSRPRYVRECRLLNILKILWGFWFSSKTPTSING
jgi:hypothetical protein